MKNWLKSKLGITALENENKLLKEQIRLHCEYVNRSMRELKDYTRVDADVGIRGNNTIILTGVYHKRAYVHFYDVGDGQFERLVDQLRHLNSHAMIRNIDAPMSFKGIFNL